MVVVVMVHFGTAVPPCTALNPGGAERNGAAAKASGSCSSQAGLGAGRKGGSGALR